MSDGKEPHPVLLGGAGAIRQLGGGGAAVGMGVSDLQAERGLINPVIARLLHSLVWAARMNDQQIPELRLSFHPQPVHCSRRFISVRDLPCR